MNIFAWIDDIPGGMKKHDTMKAIIVVGLWLI